MCILFGAIFLSACPDVSMYCTFEPSEFCAVAEYILMKRSVI